MSDVFERAVAILESGLCGECVIGKQHTCVLEVAEMVRAVRHVEGRSEFEELREANRAAIAAEYWEGRSIAPEKFRRVQGESG